MVCPAASMAGEGSTSPSVSSGSFTGSGSNQLSGPLGAATDGSTTVYVADPGNGRIEKFSSSGAFLLSFGHLGTGAGELREPYGVAVDGSGNPIVNPVFNATGQPMFNRDLNNFAPRFGFAWSFAQRMVLRGGYGIFFAPQQA